MGSRCETGAVPATVSGEPLPSNWGIGQRPASQETCLRRRPRPAGTSQRCVALRGPRPRGTSEATCRVVKGGRNMHPILLSVLAAAQAVPEPAEDPDEDIVVTAAREPVAAQNSVVPVLAVREEVGRGLAIDLPM